jgi:ABC-type glutathione transport system ATPase component
MLALLMLFQAAIYAVVLVILTHMRVTNEDSFVRAIRVVVQEWFQKPGTIEPESNDKLGWPTLPTKDEATDSEVYEAMKSIANKDASDILQIADLNITYKTEEAGKGFFDKKVEKELVVVDGLWMNVKKGECFGFLGGILH